MKYQNLRHPESADDNEGIFDHVYKNLNCTNCTI